MAFELVDVVDGLVAIKRIGGEDDEFLSVDPIISPKEEAVSTFPHHYLYE